MHLAEPVSNSWNARLGLEFIRQNGKTVLSGRRFDGPLVVQKPLYPEGPEVCHAIVVHPPAGIVGGDDLAIEAGLQAGSSVLMTTPGAGKWYRSAGPWARQRLSFDVDGVLEWLPRETIVFDGAMARLECDVRLAAGARYVGWEVLCLGRTGSGERYERGEIRIETKVAREGKLLWLERGRIEGGGALMGSPAGLAGRSVVGTLIATIENADKDLVARCRKLAAVTVLPGLLIARSLGDSSEEAMRAFTEVWKIVRPFVCGRAGVEPRIWRT